MFVATFNIASVIYRTCAIGRVFRRLIFDANFNIVSVIYHSFAVGKGFRRLMFLPLSIMFQSFTTPEL
jgi:hypothetical protein